MTEKHFVRVTLDLSVYDDLDLDRIDWRTLLDLQDNEDVHASVKEYDPYVTYWHYETPWGIGRIKRIKEGVEAEQPDFHKSTKGTL